MKHHRKLIGAALLAAALIFGMLFPGASAAQAKTITGTLRFASSADAMGVCEESRAVTAPFNYSDAWFGAPSTVYNHNLARMSLALQLSSWTAAHASNQGNENARRLDNIGRTPAADYVHKLYRDIGFQPLQYFHYDVPLTDESDKVAFSLAEKWVNLNGSRFVILAMTPRGGNYGGEWVSNGNVGDGDALAGFDAAGKEIVREIEKQLAAYPEGVTVKLWLNGYSRSGGAANLAAGALDKAIAAGKLRVKKNDLFCYNFAVPLCTKDPGANGTDYANIFNIINPVDVIMIAPFRDWGFKRYGVGKYLQFLDEGPAFEALNAKYVKMFDETCDEGIDFTFHLTTQEQFRTLYLIDSLVPVFMDSTAGLMGFQDGMQNLIRSFFVQGRLMPDIENKDWQAVYEDILGKGDPLWRPVHLANSALVLPVNFPAALLGNGPDTIDPALLSMIVCALVRVGGALAEEPPDLLHIAGSLPEAASAITVYMNSAPAEEEGEEPQGFTDNIRTAHSSESYWVLMGVPEKDAFGTGQLGNMKVT